jgi:hypothetical protein
MVYGGLKIYLGERMTKVTITETLREPETTPIEAYTLEVISNSTDKVFGRLIILPEVDIDQKVKCISSCGEESFTYNIHGRLYMDFDYDIKDVQVNGEVTVIMVG